jgi:hypothetical protein
MTSVKNVTKYKYDTNRMQRSASIVLIVKQILHLCTVQPYSGLVLWLSQESEANGGGGGLGRAILMLTPCVAWPGGK